MNGWLSPDGKFHECAIMGHIEKAKELFLSDNPEQSLESLHWLKIIPNYVFSSVDNDDVSLITQSQADWLYDLLQTDEPSWILRDVIQDILKTVEVI